MRELAFLFLLARLRAGEATANQFTAAVYTVTQRAFDDAPERYGKFVTDMLAEVASTQVPAQEDWGNCDTRFRIGPAGLNCSIALVTDTLKLALAEGQNLNVSAVIDVDVPARTSIEKCFELFWCFCSTVCDNDLVHYRARLAVNIVINFQWDNTNKQVTVTIPTNGISLSTVTGPDVEGCHPSGWVDFFFDWQSTLNEQVQDKIISFAQQFQQSLNVPPEIQPVEGLYVRYAIQSVTWTPMQFAELTAVATVTGTIGPANETFVPDPYINTLPIALYDFPPTDPADPASHLLQGSRISSVFLTALTWYADRTGALNYHTNGTVLDSWLNVTMFIAPPQIDIPRNDSINVTISGGRFAATCHPVDERPPVFNTLLEIDFSDLQGNGKVSYTNDSLPGLVLQIEELIFDYLTLQPVKPDLPLPANLEYGIVKNAIDQSRPIINTYLSGHPMILPESIKPFVAHPAIRAVEGIPQRSMGYVQVLSYCSCDTHSAAFVLCKPSSGICPTAVISQQTPSEAAQKTAVKPTADLEDIQPNFGSGELIEIRQYFNQKCSEAPKASIFQVPITGSLCLPQVQNSGMYFSLGGRSGPLKMFCSNETCTDCSIQIGRINSGKCYPQGEQSVSIGSSCEREKLEPDLLILQQFTNLTANCRPSSPIGANFTAESSLTALMIDYNDSCLHVPGTDQYARVLRHSGDPEKFDIVALCPDDTCSDNTCVFGGVNISTYQCLNTAKYSIQFIPPKNQCPLPYDFTWAIKYIVLFGTVILIGGILLGDCMCFKSRGAKSLYQALKKICSFIIFDGWRISKNCILTTVILIGRMFRFIASNIGVRRTWYLEDVFQHFLTFLCAAIGIWQSRVWILFDNIFTVFSGNISDKYSVPSEMVDSTQVSQFFVQWETKIAQFLLLFSLLVTVPFTLYIFLINVRFRHMAIIRMAFIGALFIASVCIPILPMYTEDFAHLIELGSKQSTGIENDKIYKFVESSLQESFTGLVTSSFAGLLLNLFQGLNGGIFLAVLTHELIYQPDYTKKPAIFQVYNLLVFASLLQVFFSIHPVIVWSQYSSTSSEFFLVNALLWVLPLILWLIKSFFVGIFENYQPSGRFASPIMLIYLVVYIFANGFSFWMQVTYYEPALEMSDFIVSCFLGTLCYTFALSYMFLTLKHRNQSYFVQITLKGFKVRNENAQNVNDRDALIPRGENNIRPRNPNRPDLNAPERPPANRNQQPEDEHEQLSFNCCSVTCNCASRSGLARKAVRGVIFTLDWLLETREHSDPARHGLKIEKRRLFLIVGCLAFSYFTFHFVKAELVFDSKTQIQQLLDKFGVDLAWPENQTIFDDAFRVYNAANLHQTLAMAAACGCFWLALLADWLSYLADATKWKKRHLLASRLAGLIGGALVCASIAILAAPNYMQAIHFDELCADCGEELNRTVYTAAQFITGLLFGTLFTVELAPVLFTIGPSIVRTSVLILLHPTFDRQRFRQWDRRAAGEVDREANVFRGKLLRGVAVMGSLTAIPITLLAMGALVQLETNSTVTLIAVLFWFIPPSLLILGVLLNLYTKEKSHLLYTYIAYTFSYFSLLVLLVCYCLSLYGKLSIITEELKTFMFYCEIVAEIFLTNIALSDLLYISMF